MLALADAATASKDEKRSTPEWYKPHCLSGQKGIELFVISKPPESEMIHFGRPMVLCPWGAPQDRTRSLYGWGISYFILHISYFILHTSVYSGGMNSSSRNSQEL
jgi:hypothetical protein